MFRSRIRNLILPQFEHSRLAGMLAWYWGNDEFDRPPVDFAGFAKGVTLHDWHYGMLDNHPLGETRHEDWLAVAEAGVAVDYDDPVTDTVAKYHLRWLIGEPPDAATEDLLERLEAKIDTRTRQTPYPPVAFEWTDRITQFCDGVAFHFGFENRGWHTSPVHAQTDNYSDTDVAYEITGDCVIRFQPWPFSASEFTEQVIHFPADGYPNRLAPQVSLVRCVPAA